MVAPGPGAWLTLEDYKGWARIDAADTTDDVAIADAVAATMETLELRAPVAFPVDAVTGEPLAPVPSSVFQAGLLLANRLMARRNSPDGIVGVSDMGTARVLSYDADIQTLVAPWTESVVA